MKMSVREARANFAHALDAAERGEQVTITRNGKAIAQIGPAATQIQPFSFERNEEVRKKLGLDKYDGPPLDDKWLEQFNDPAWGRELFGLGDDWQPEKA